MPTTVNLTEGTSPRNGTTGHTVTIPATTSGSLLVGVFEAPAVITLPGGWTKRQNPVNLTELCVATKTAGAGETSIAVTLSASNYPLGYVVYEFANGSAWVTSNSASNASSWTALTGLPGTAVSVFGAIGRGVDAGLATGLTTSWSAPWAEEYGVNVPFAVTDGFIFTVGYQDGVTATSATPNGSISGAGNSVTERIVFAVTVAAAGDTTAPTVPTGLTSTALGSTTADLSWTASTDAVGVTQYEVSVIGP